MASGSEDLDLVHYTALPQLDVPSTVALTAEILTRVPKKADAGVRKAAKGLRTALEALKAGWHGEKALPEPEVGRRKADNDNDTAWSALDHRLEAWAWLPADLHPESARAAAVRKRLFPEGLTFLTYAFKAQWAEGQNRLEQIEKDKLAPEIDALAGKSFLEEVRRTHEVYGRVLGILEVPPEAPEQARLDEPLNELRQALRRYALKVVNTAEPGDAASIAAVHAALGPIDLARPARSKGEAPAAPTPAPASGG